MKRRGPYSIVYADPPWPRTAFGTARTPYDSMTWDELMDFDLGAYMAKDSIAFIWTTGPTHLRECKVLSHWCHKFGLHEAGIAYKWIKTRRDPLPTMPPSYSLRGGPKSGYHVRRDGDSIEEIDEERGNDFDDQPSAIAAAWAHWRRRHATRDWITLVDAVKKFGVPIGASGPRPRTVKQLGEDVIALSSKNGRVFPLLTESQVQWVFAPKPRRGEHSSKPHEVRDNIVELLGDLNRIELFSRDVVDGWDGHGDQYPGQAVIL